MEVTHYGFVPMVHPVLPDVVRIQDAQVRVLPSRLLLCDMLEAHRASEFRYAKRTLPPSGSGPNLTSPTFPYPDSNYDVSLLRFVAQ